MQIYTLDFETYFADDYTLRKMTTEEYVRDPRFEALLLGVIYPDGNKAWFPQEEIPGFLRSVDWSKAAILAHHAHFDGLILAHHYGVRPAIWLDTLSMSRLLRGHHVSHSLEKLAEALALPAKSVPYDMFRNRHWADISPALRRALGEGCLLDAELTRAAFDTLAPKMPAEEFAVIDMTVRMYTEPRFVGDMEKFGAVWRAEEARKTDALLQLGITEKELQSAETFAALLRERGVDPEKKPGKNNQIYAFAKTDQFMQDLLESPDEELALLAATRLGVKSTIDQTRAARLGNMAMRGKMPVYLHYCGAHTTRWSGGDKVNWQNFRRGGALREGIRAPQGWKIVKADLSQIEARMLAQCAGQWDLVEKFRRGEDPYVGIATKFYGFEVTKAHKTERQFGKVLILQCGFQSGAATIRRTAKRSGVILSPEQAEEAKALYRAENSAIVNYWSQAGRIIGAIAGTSQPVQWGVLRVETNVIYLPNGAPLWYPDLEFYRDPDTDEEYWRYRSRRGWAKIYSGKLVENVIQALARVVMSQACLRIKKRLNGLLPAHLEHDAGAWVVPEAYAERVKGVVEEELRRAPTWMPEIPLDCEASIGDHL